MTACRPRRQRRRERRRCHGKTGQRGGPGLRRGGGPRNCNVHRGAGRVLGGGGRCRSRSLCVGEFGFELVDTLLELFGSLSVQVAGRVQIADPNFESLALRLACGGLGLPDVAGPHQLGDEDAGRGSECGESGHGASCPDRRNTFTKQNPHRRETPDQLPFRRGLTRLVFHTGDAAGARAFHQASQTWQQNLEQGKPRVVSDLIVELESMGFQWGVSDGN